MLAWNSLYSPGCPWSCSNPPGSASQVLGYRYEFSVLSWTLSGVCMYMAGQRMTSGGVISHQSLQSLDWISGVCLSLFPKGWDFTPLLSWLAFFLTSVLGIKFKLWCYWSKNSAKWAISLALSNFWEVIFSCDLVVSLLENEAYEIAFSKEVLQRQLGTRHNQLCLYVSPDVAICIGYSVRVTSF